MTWQIMPGYSTRMGGGMDPSVSPWRLTSGTEELASPPLCGVSKLRVGPD
jgi:hypothetical protein